MNAPTYDKSISALLVVDPYSDFISEGGKIWPRIKAVAEKVLNAAREVKLRVFYAMHHRYRAGDYENVDLHCADSTSHVVAQELRIRHMGWRVPCRIRAGTRWDCRTGTLVFQWLRQH